MRTEVIYDFASPYIPGINSQDNDTDEGISNLGDQPVLVSLNSAREPTAVVPED